MSGLQRDHSVNENWTNGSGYNDGTAGAARSTKCGEMELRCRAPSMLSVVWSKRLWNKDFIKENFYFHCSLCIPQFAQLI